MDKDAFEYGAIRAAGVAAAIVLPAGSLFFLWTIWLGKKRLISKIVELLSADQQGSQVAFDVPANRGQLWQLNYKELILICKLTRHMTGHRSFEWDSASEDHPVVAEANLLHAKIKDSRIVEKINFNPLEVALFGTRLIHS